MKIGNWQSYTIGIVIAHKICMKCHLKSKSLSTLLPFFILLAMPFHLSASIQSSSSVPDHTPLKKIISITTEQTTSKTIVNVIGNGMISKYTTRIIDFPPRIIVDISYTANPLGSMTIPVKSPLLKCIRVGYHSKIIRLVLDLKGTNMPIFKTKSANNTLSIFLRSEGLRDNTISVLEKHTPNYIKTRGLWAKVSIPSSCLPAIPGTDIESEQPRSSPQSTMEISAFEQLVEIEGDDDKDDTVFFLNCVNAYKSKNWEDAIENCNHLIKAYPEGRYAERAYFLRALSYEQLHSHFIEAHYTDVKRYYEDVINRFSDSIYVPETLLAIGNICFKSKNYYEALGYYNLILKKDKDSIAALRASMQKAKILILKKKREEALSTLKYVARRFPGSPEETEAKIEIAKIFYEMNNFRRSITILSDLRKVHSENIYQYPEIFLYLGYNYYELKDAIKARENLLSFYNTCPDREINHLVLTKIADTYRDEGLINDAVKIYQLVSELYPDKEGALISLIRIAEQKEKRKVELKRGIEPSIKIVGREIGLPREIYEDIMDNILKKDEKNPLAQLALLKLAILYHREKDFDKSLKALKELLDKYPKTSLRKECKHALNKTLGAILKEEMKNRRYNNIINIYNKERDLFLMINSPDPFLIIARVSKSLKLYDMATEMFIRADSLLPDNEKSADLLFSVGSAFFKEKNDFTKALSRLDLLIDHYPTDKNVPHAYHLKGKILIKQEKYPQAVEMLSSALRYDLRRCERAKILIDQASAFMRCNLPEKALWATGEADKLKRDCHIHYPHIYHDIGDIYLRLGYPKKALFTFNAALEREKEYENKIRLQLMIAQCYKLLDKKKDYLALYEKISSLNDPFWSNLAKEKIDQINFAREIRETKKK